MLKNEKELLKRCLKGDKKAMETIVINYQKPIFNYFYRNVRNREIVSDLTQDIFLKVFSNLRKYNFSYKFSTWIYTLSHNHLIDYYRKKKNISFSTYSHDGNDTLDFPDEKNLTKEEEMIENEIKDKVWKSVELLPEEYRELIIMRYVNGLKYEEISEILKIPMGTLKNKIFRAKRKLINLIKESEK